MGPSHAWFTLWGRGSSGRCSRAPLTEVKGAGTWTAEIFLMFVLGRSYVLPLGYLGIRDGFQGVYGLRKEPSAASNSGQWVSMASTRLRLGVTGR